MLRGPVPCGGCPIPAAPRPPPCQLLMRNASDGRYTLTPSRRRRGGWGPSRIPHRDRGPGPRGSAGGGRFEGPSRLRRQQIGDAREALQVVDVVRERRHAARRGCRRWSRPRARPRAPSGGAGPSCPRRVSSSAARRRRSAAPAPSVSPRAASAPSTSAAAGHVAVDGVDAVHHERVAAHALLAQPVGEVEHLAHAERVGRGDEHVGDVGPAQGAGDLVGARPPARRRCR